MNSGGGCWNTFASHIDNYALTVLGVAKSFTSLKEKKFPCEWRYQFRGYKDKSRPLI